MYIIRVVKASNHDEVVRELPTKYEDFDKAVRNAQSVWVALTDKTLNIVVANEEGTPIYTFEWDD